MATMAAAHHHYNHRSHSHNQPIQQAAIMQNRCKCNNETKTKISSMRIDTSLLQHSRREREIFTRKLYYINETCTMHRYSIFAVKWIKLAARQHVHFLQRVVSKTQPLTEWFLFDSPIFSFSSVCFSLSLSRSFLFLGCTLLMWSSSALSRSALSIRRARALRRRSPVC